jgi:hypothetical protein
MILHVDLRTVQTATYWMSLLPYAASRPGRRVKIDDAPAQLTPRPVQRSRTGSSPTREVRAAGSDEACHTSSQRAYSRRARATTQANGWAAQWLLRACKVANARWCRRKSVTVSKGSQQQLGPTATKMDTTCGWKAKHSTKDVRSPRSACVFNVSKLAVNCACRQSGEAAWRGFVVQPSVQCSPYYAMGVIFLALHQGLLEQFSGATTCCT